jgi:chemotaxis protein CheZ
MTPDAFRELSADTRGFLTAVGEGARATGTQLHEIMMAQDFQDLTGQVIKRLLELTHTLETQLLQVLIEAAPAQVREEDDSGLLNGPVIDTGGRSDVVQDQSQVDELLERLGF